MLHPSALAEFDEPKRSTFIMFGVLTIAVRIYHDRWGYGVYSGPIGTAVLVITVKWVRGAGLWDGLCGVLLVGKGLNPAWGSPTRASDFLLKVQLSVSQ